MARASRRRSGVNAHEVLKLCKAVYKKGPWPTETQCYRIAVAIETVCKSRPAIEKNRSRLYRERRKAVAAMKRLIRSRKREIKGWGLQLPGDMEDLRALDALASALVEAEVALCPSDPLAGQRVSGAWHKPLRYLAGKIEQVLREAGHTEISRARASRFVRLMASVLALVGIHKELGAVSFALKAAY